MGARDEALGLEDVRTEFVDVARCAGEVAGGLDAAGEGAGLHLEALDVVRLPAVHGQVEVLELGEHFFGVHADGGVTLLRNGVSLVDVLFH